MTDQHPADGSVEEANATGVPAVDAALETVEGLQERPLDEHVAAYESAHQQLRRALDAAPDQS